MGNGDGPSSVSDGLTTRSRSPAEYEESLMTPVGVDSIGCAHKPADIERKRLMSHWNAECGSTDFAGQIRQQLRTLLRGNGGAPGKRWQSWSAALLQSEHLSPRLLFEVWEEVLAFDPILANYVLKPISVPGSAVIVADSGRQSFKTFNVGTAACILAAAAGAHVVHGVSRSVSSTPGSVDVLAVLGISATSMPAMVATRLERNRIAFVDHGTFCPTYVDGYDRIFSSLSPFSFFLPIAALAVRASTFVYGIADTDVSMATHAIRAARPDLTRGLVVAGELGPQEVLATHAGYGLDHTAMLDGDDVTVHRRPRHAPPSRWRPAVAHQPTHEGNAAMLVDCLTPDGDGARIHLVERHAAIILAAAHWAEIDQGAALTHVRNVRIAGGAIRLLKQLQADEEMDR